MAIEWHIGEETGRKESWLWARLKRNCSAYLDARGEAFSQRANSVGHKQRNSKNAKGLSDTALTEPYGGRYDHSSLSLQWFLIA